MFVVGNFLIAVATILGIILWSVKWLIIIRALISWVNPDPYNPVVQFLYKTTEPILQPIRRFMPPMAIDISPIIALIGIIFLNIFLVGSIHDLGLRLKAQSAPRATYQLQPTTIQESSGGEEDTTGFMRR